MNQTGSRWAAGALMSLLCATAVLAAGTVELVSRANPRRLSDTASGAPPDNLAFPPPSLSADGRWVAFLSSASNLVTGQTKPPGKLGFDLFLRDRISGSTLLVSHAAGSPTAASALGVESAVLSADGRWLAFVSPSDDLVPGLSFSPYQPRRLFLFDRVSGTTARIAPSAYLESNDGTGVRQIAISGDGRFLAFASGAPDLVPGQQDANHALDVFLYDRVAGTTTLVSHAGSATMAGNGESQYVSLSADGRWLAFATNATDLVPGLTGAGGTILYDRLSGGLRLLGPGFSRPQVSADGGTVLFYSTAPDLVPGQTDTNGTWDAFLYDRAAGTTTLVSHAAGLPTTAGNGGVVALFGAAPLLSADGRWVAFLSNATNLVPGMATRPGFPANLFLYDRNSGAAVLASRSGSSPATPGSSGADEPFLSADGRFAAFVSRSPDQVSGQVEGSPFITENVFLFDRGSGTVSLVSGANGSPTLTGDRFSYSPAVSADGSLIAYYSLADDLQAGVKDLNAGQDVVLYETASRSNAYATVHPSGAASATPDAVSALRGLSGDGRWVLFESGAVNLVPGQTGPGGLAELFLYDHATQTKVLVSRSAASPTAVADAGAVEPALSADGRYVAFISNATNLVTGVNDRPIDPETGFPSSNYDVFVFDRAAGSVTLVTRSAADPGAAANRGSFSPSISADGRWVAFDSVATDLVQGAGDANRAPDVFLWDRATGAMALVSRSAASPLQTANGSSSAAVVSADGRYVAYQSTAADLVPGQTGAGGTISNLFLFDRVTGATALVSHTRDGAGVGAGIFADDLPSLSADGRYVLFSSFRTDLAGSPGQDLCHYLYDRVSGQLALVGWTSPRGSARSPVLSADGRWAAFASNADLVPGVFNELQTDQIYLYDRVSGALTLITRSALQAGRTSAGTSEAPSISADGRSVAFASRAPDLVSGEVQQIAGALAVYLFDRVTGQLTLISHPPASALTAVDGFAPRVSADGKSAGFDSGSPDLVAGDSNGRTDVFLYRAGGTPSGPVTLPPCNLFSGALRSNARKTLTVAGACGVPAGAKQVILKLAVSQGTGKGNVQVYPGNVTNLATGILRFTRGASRSAGFTVPLGNGGIALLPFVNGNGTVRVTVEVDGYVP